MADDQARTSILRPDPSGHRLVPPETGEVLRPSDTDSVLSPASPKPIQPMLGLGGQISGGMPGRFGSFASPELPPEYQKYLVQSDLSGIGAGRSAAGRASSANPIGSMDDVSSIARLSGMRSQGEYGNNTRDGGETLRSSRNDEVPRELTRELLQPSEEGERLVPVDAFSDEPLRSVGEVPQSERGLRELLRERLRPDVTGENLHRPNVAELMTSGTPMGQREIMESLETRMRQVETVERFQDSRTLSEQVGQPRMPSVPLLSCQDRGPVREGNCVPLGIEEPALRQKRVPSTGRNVEFLHSANLRYASTDDPTAAIADPNAVYAKRMVVPDFGEMFRPSRNDTEAPKGLSINSDWQDSKRESLRYGNEGELLTKDSRSQKLVYSNFPTEMTRIVGGDDEPVEHYKPCTDPFSPKPLDTCFDWITGPASTVNSNLKVYYYDNALGKWIPETLHETDQGWLVMSPDTVDNKGLVHQGTKLELVAFGDTFYENPNNPISLTDCYKQGAKYCGANSECTKIFKKLSKADACNYIYGMFREKHLWDDYNNVVFFNARINNNKTFHIDFLEHLYHKAIVKNQAELKEKHWTGIYTNDYFYVCPKDFAKCQGEEILYFPTGTVYWWKGGKPLDDLTKEQKEFTLKTTGGGFYRFGTIRTKDNKCTQDWLRSTNQEVQVHPEPVPDPGCRLRFDSAANVPWFDPSCPKRPSSNLRPKNYQEYGSGLGEYVEYSSNPNVLWGIGSKFAYTIVAHGFNDKYHSSGSNESSDYVYFIGSGEFQSKPYGANSVKYLPSGNIYMARVLANETSLQNAKFEYFTGFSGSKVKVSQWGPYQKAKAILTSIVNPSSFTKRFGKYYMTGGWKTTINNFDLHGMAVIWSSDGFTWKSTDSDFATYAYAPKNGNFSFEFLYGHAWVPEAIYPNSPYIPYVFSVEKSFDGFFEDFWNPNQKYPIAQKKQFWTYNTKMYFYKTK